MIEQLRYAGDQLRAAWNNYCQVYSSIQACDARGIPVHTCNFPHELARLLDTELDFICSLGPKIQELKHTISRAHKYSLRPINSIPPGILIRIFHFVLAESCGIQFLSSNVPDYKPRRYPDYLAQVCASWRRAALSAPSLWCHIDLSPNELYCDRLITRAWTCVERVGNLPIELHIGGDEYDFFEETPDIHSGLCSLLLSISSRVKTLELSVPHDFGYFHHTAFHALFFGQQSYLTKFVICSNRTHSRSFISAKGADSDYRPFQLSISADWLESGFATLKVLHLYGAFPLWSSRGYHGLVDLRLLPSPGISFIQDTEFVTILNSSPGLRILHFGLEIRNTGSPTSQPAPVHLHDLCVLKIFYAGLGYQNRDGTVNVNILRLLTPGSKPLRLCLSGDPEYQLETDLEMELERIFAQSRVTKFCAQEISLPISILLRHAAHLECVVLDEFDSNYMIPIKFPNNLPSLPRLRLLDITRSNLSEREFRLLLECCPTCITLYSSRIRPDNSDGLLPMTDEECSEAFPAVKFGDRTFHIGENPTDSWDVLD